MTVVLTMVFCFVRTADSRIRVISTDNTGVTVEYLPELSQPVAVDNGIIQLSLREGDNISAPGRPKLPIYIAAVAVPPDSKPHVRLLSRESGRAWKGSLPIFRGSDKKAANITSFPLLRQSETIGSVETRSLCGLKVLRIPICPARISRNPAEVELADRIVFHVDFGTYRSVEGLRPARISGLVKSIVVNAEQAAGWGNYTTSHFTEPLWEPQSSFTYRFQVSEEGIYRLTFDDLVDAGVELPQGGVTSSLIRIYGNGGAELPRDPGAVAVLGIEECAVYMNDGGDNVFGPGDWLLFHGRGAGGRVRHSDNVWRYAVNHYSTVNHYWLYIDPSGGGRRMESFGVNARPETVSGTGIAHYYYEPEGYIYNIGSFKNSGIEWYGHNFDGPSRISYGFNLQHPVLNLPVVLKVRIVKSFGSPSITISLNGVHIDTFEPEGPKGPNFLFGYPVSGDIRSQLRSNVNNLLFEQVTPLSQAHFDWFEVTYHAQLDQAVSFEGVEFDGIVKYEISTLDDPWIFDVTDHGHVGLERGSSFTIIQSGETGRYILVTPADFKSITSPFVEYFPPDKDFNDLFSFRNRADVLLITPDGFWDAVEPLLGYYANRKPSLRAGRVRLSEIYSHFSGGLRDPTAIRNLLMYAKDNWGKLSVNDTPDPPDFVVLCGDGDYNYRDIDRPASENFLPPNEYDVLCSDDWFVDFTSITEDSLHPPLPEMAHGRLTGVNAAEMSNIVEKIISYIEEPEFGPWRNRVTLVADDEFGDKWSGEFEHVEYNEDLSDIIPDHFDRVKIYLTEYERQMGRVKLLAADDLLNSINNGTILINFMGHGNHTLWAHEHVFVLSRDLPRIEPSRRLPVYVAFTCDWAFWDDPSSQSFPEQLLALPERGAIGIIASTRLTGSLSNSRLAVNFFTFLFLGSDLEPDPMTLGGALMHAKWRYITRTNTPSYHLLGDPTMHLGTPRRKGKITSLAPFPLIPLEISEVTGQVNDIQGDNDTTIRIDHTFSGLVNLQVQDTRVFQEHPTRNYYRSGPTIFRGRYSLNDGEFSGQFIVPRDVTLGGEYGRVIAYFYNDETDGVTVKDTVAFADLVSDAIDNEPPEIDIFLGSRAFRPGDIVGPEPLLIVDLADESGLNLTGALGHGINVTIDDSRPVDLTDYFEYNLDSYREGSLIKRVGPLDPGIHTIEIQAWDSFNNPAIASLEVDVTDEAGGFRIHRVLNWPNPLRRGDDVTNLTFMVTSNSPYKERYEIYDYEIKIFTVNGRMIWKENSSSDKSYNRDIFWNGRDDDGRLVGNGVYLYKVIAWDENGNSSEGLGRIAVMR